MYFQEYFLVWITQHSDFITTSTCLVFSNEFYWCMGWERWATLLNSPSDTFSNSKNFKNTYFFSNFKALFGNNIYTKLHIDTLQMTLKHVLHDFCGLFCFGVVFFGVFCMFGFCWFVFVVVVVCCLFVAFFFSCGKSILKTEAHKIKTEEHTMFLRPSGSKILNEEKKSSLGFLISKRTLIAKDVYSLIKGLWSMKSLRHLNISPYTLNDL